MKCDFRIYDIKCMSNSVSLSRFHSYIIQIIISWNEKNPYVTLL